ncbi:DEAD/DEAH box helicase family protein [Desulforhopalus vacuolatus]|uniref:DEAD/DEAH box helicase family protein n=1 Tax=Desulforhopalus vacuolatus TaxID=40414 RepID=UPI0019651245|nr:DEAD/DEAH box helicase family protein [Desulforhopalus vacuolatus]MBM9518311.1 DEAD/DEAH box helicase family protein [Desulforhopalus vacuolatus]
MGSQLNEKAPLHALDISASTQDPSIGLVIARAGLGKTAILVQFALDNMLQGNKVLHVAIGAGVEKTRTWYEDLLRTINGEDIEEIPGIMKQRMIMTFQESSFSKALLAERFNDLVDQDIFSPDCLIIDDYDFENCSRSDLEELIAFIKERNLQMAWFSATSHREDDRKSASGVPAPCNEIEDLFNNVLFISPAEKEITLDILKSDSSKVKVGTSLHLDPSTMLIKKG